MPIIAIVILVYSRQDETKTKQGKARQDEIYIDSLHIMTMTKTTTATMIMIMTMTIIIQ